MISLLLDQINLLYLRAHCSYNTVITTFDVLLDSEVDVNKPYTIDHTRYSTASGYIAYVKITDSERSFLNIIDADGHTVSH